MTSRTSLLKENHISFVDIRFSFLSLGTTCNMLLTDLQLPQINLK